MKPAQPALGATTRRLFRDPIMVICATVVTFFACQFIGVMLASIFTPYVQNETYQLLLIIFFGMVSLVGFISLGMHLLKFNIRAIGLNKPKAKTLWMIIPAFFVYFFASAIFTLLATKFLPGFKSDQIQDVGFSTLKQSSELIAAFVSLVILTPIFEEVIFRGILFKGLRRRLPLWSSAVLASLIFAVAHMQWNVGVDVFALSLVLCFLAEKTDSIIPGIILHGLKNTLAFVLLFIIK